MDLKLVGAGIGRTGTLSLKLALEQLLGAPCYHMLEVFEHPEHIAEWQRAFDGDAVDWSRVFEDYIAIVDWPGGGCWRELSAEYPEAVVLLSVRESADAWWRSATATVFAAMQRVDPTGTNTDPWPTMVRSMMARFTPNWRDEAASKAAYERHNAEVRAEVPAHRLVEWQPGDGWDPLCRALGMAVPDTPFPHANTTDDFKAMMGLE
jgi:hypothetical protein